MVLVLNFKIHDLDFKALQFQSGLLTIKRQVLILVLALKRLERFETFKETGKRRIVIQKIVHGLAPRSKQYLVLRYKRMFGFATCWYSTSYGRLYRINAVNLNNSSILMSGQMTLAMSFNTGFEVVNFKWSSL